MRLNLTSYCRLIRAMQIYHSKTTREDKPAPEIRWIIGKDIRIIGFADFKYQIRLSVARLDGEDCGVPGDDSIEFFTEVPAAFNFDDAARDTEVIIDTESSQSHLVVYTDDFEYKIRKVPYSEPLEFRQKNLPINQFIVEGSIQREKLCQFINLCPDETLRLKVTEGIIKLVSDSKDEKVEYVITDENTVSSETIRYSYSFSVESLYEAVKNIPKKTQVQLFITEEFIRLRYELGDVGFMNYYQRNKDDRSVFVI